MKSAALFPVATVSILVTNISKNVIFASILLPYFVSNLVINAVTSPLIMVLRLVVNGAATVVVVEVVIVGPDVVVELIVRSTTLLQYLFISSMIAHTL